MRTATEAEPTSRPSLRVILAVWAVYGLIASARQDLGSVLEGRRGPLWYGFALQLPLAFFWAALTPVILRMARRFPIRGPHWILHVVIHAIASVGVVFCLDLLFASYLPVLSHVVTPPLQLLPLIPQAERLFVYWVMEDAVVYWVIVAVGHALEATAGARAREIRESRLEGQLAQAELHALKMQVHPHFLFNALHTVGTLIRKGESAVAVQVIGRLGDLLRRMLDGAATQEVTLQEELDFARNYLEVEQARFPDRLRVTWAVDDAVLGARVPHLVLQPLLENAIRHGIATSTAAGALAIEARCVEGVLHLIIRDDGPGLANRQADGAVGRGGVGLENIRLRLARLYGDRGGLDVVNLPGGGAGAHVRLPFRAATAAAS